MAAEIFYNSALSVRRIEMAKQLDKDHDQKAADFDYRRRICDDIETILRKNDVFRPDVSSGSQAEQDALLRLVSEDIVSYIIN